MKLKSLILVEELYLLLTKRLFKLIEKNLTEHRWTHFIEFIKFIFQQISPSCGPSENFDNSNPIAKLNINSNIFI